MTVLGIDISKWNGAWDAQKAMSAGAVFAFIKSSQATFTDIMFQVNWQKAKSAGLLRGAYHYMDFAKPARDQANYFASLLDKDPGELPPVVDYEQAHPDNNYSLARSYLREFVEQLKTRGYKPIIYTGPGYWGTYGEKTSYWANFPLWIAHYTTAPGPTVPEPWTRWTFWQYSVKGNGEIYGTESYSVDMNRFDGTLDDLRAFAGLPTAATNLEATVNTLAQRISTLEQRVTKLEGGNGQGSEPPAPPPANNNETWATCTASGLNVRSGPGTTHAVVGAITYGQKVKVLARQDGWAQIESPAGWCSEKYLDFNQPGTVTVTPPPNYTWATCTASGLNVRSGPGTDYPVIGGLVYGQRVKVLTRQNGWAQIENPAGWSGEKYLRFDTVSA